MTADRNVDRISRAWLDLMPSEAPDRAVTAVLQAVETTPQVRRPWRRLPRRSPPMNRLLIAATVAAIAIAGVGGAMPDRKRQFDDRANATTSAQHERRCIPPERPRSAVARALPGTCRGSAPVVDTRLVLNDEFRGVDRHGLRRSPVRLGCPDDRRHARGHLTRDVTQGPDTCAAGDIGLYATTLAPEGSRLQSKQSGRLRCARHRVRRGLVAHGVHDRQHLPRPARRGHLPDRALRTPVSIRRPWQSEFGALTYTVPDGWAIVRLATSATFELVPAAELPLETPDGPPDGDSDGSRHGSARRDDARILRAPTTSSRASDGPPEALAAWFADGPESGCRRPTADHGGRSRRPDDRYRHCARPHRDVRLPAPGRPTAR